MSGTQTLWSRCWGGGAACESLEQAGRLAWQNAARCVGRLHWRSLKVLGARSVATVDDIADSLAQHLQFATNDGRIRPVMSVFTAMEEAACARDVAPGMRIWNHQLLGYAG